VFLKQNKDKSLRCIVENNASQIVNFQLTTGLERPKNKLLRVYYLAGSNNIANIVNID